MLREKWFYLWMLYLYFHSSFHYTVAIRIHEIFIWFQDEGLHVLLIFVFFGWGLWVVVVITAQVRIFSCNIQLALVDPFLKSLDDLRNNNISQSLWIMIFFLNKLTSQNQIESIFDLWLCSAIDHVGNFSPFVSHIQPLLQKVQIFAEAPLAFIDRRVQCCEPSFSTLLTIPLRELEFIFLIYRNRLHKFQNRLI